MSTEKTAAELVRSVPEFTGYEPAHLDCPHCGQANMHHRGVVMYDREEDAEITMRTRIVRGMVQSVPVPSAGSGNPSDRRDGLAILFECEQCGRLSELTFAQHKGDTHVAWRKPKPFQS